MLVECYQLCQHSSAFLNTAASLLSTAAAVAPVLEVINAKIDVFMLFGDGDLLIYRRLLINYESDNHLSVDKSQVFS